jgi:hypothetical protein
VPPVAADSSTHFCPECGATVYFELAVVPGAVGIPVGAFADPSFLAPQGEEAPLSTGAARCPYPGLVGPAAHDARMRWRR